MSPVFVGQDIFVGQKRVCLSSRFLLKGTHKCRRYITTHIRGLPATHRFCVDSCATHTNMSDSTSMWTRRFDATITRVYTNAEWSIAHVELT